MIRRAGRHIAVSSIALSLLLQGPTALAACICEMPAGGACGAGDVRTTCTASPAESTEPRACCSPATAERAAHCSKPEAPADGRLTISSRCCEKALVFGETLSDATLPVESFAGDRATPSAPALVPSPVAEVDAERRASYGLLRAPPPSRTAPLFLLNAAFLI